MPAWFIEVVSRSPWVALIGFVCHYGYRTLKHVTGLPPESLAALGGVFGGKRRREDARELLRTLRDGQRDPERPAPRLKAATSGKGRRRPHGS